MSSDYVPWPLLSGRESDRRQKASERTDGPSKGKLARRSPRTHATGSRGLREHRFTLEVTGSTCSSRLFLSFSFKLARKRAANAGGRVSRSRQTSSAGSPQTVLAGRPTPISRRFLRASDRQLPSSRSLSANTPAHSLLARPSLESESSSSAAGAKGRLERGVRALAWGSSQT